jgi:hypothetical protein
VLIIGCTDPSTAPCDGFNQEPYVNVVGDLEDTFGIYYLNAESFGDTLFTSDGSLQLPVDPQGQEMYYEVITDSSLGIFKVNYDLQPQYCESADELVLLFNEMRFDTSSTFLKLSTSDGNTSREIDTSFRYSSFFNKPKSNHHLIIHF